MPVRYTHMLLQLGHYYAHIEDRPSNDLYGLDPFLVNQAMTYDTPPMPKISFVRFVLRFYRPMPTIPLASTRDFTYTRSEIRLSGR